MYSVSSVNVSSVAAGHWLAKSVRKSGSNMVIEKQSSPETAYRSYSNFSLCACTPGRWLQALNRPRNNSAS